MKPSALLGPCEDKGFWSSVVSRGAGRGRLPWMAPCWLPPASPGRALLLRFLHFLSAAAFLSLPGRRVWPGDMGRVGSLPPPFTLTAEKEGTPTYGQAPLEL